MDNNEAAPGGPIERLESKVDALACSVGKMNERLGGKIDALGEAVGETHTRLGGVETRLTGVEKQILGLDTRLTGVERQLVTVERQLVTIEDVAVETKKFSRNVWDSVTSLTQKVEQGFEDARKERKEGFDLVHKAIRDWGGRVRDLETARTRTTKRRP